MNYKTPGVYIEEVSVFPPSVAQVETAIPAFIGYTATALNDTGAEADSADFPYIRRISSMLEYEKYFGGAQPQGMQVVLENDQPDSVIIDAVSRYRLYYALQLFYANGGGPCYIASVGTYGAPASENVVLSDLQAGLSAIGLKDEPTLLLFPDAPGINGADLASQQNNFHQILKDALMQCDRLKDRFLISDLFTSDGLSNADFETFRNGIGNNFLKYGAAYHPWLRTSIPYFYSDAGITFDASSGSNTNAELDTLNLADVLARQQAENQSAIIADLQAAVNGLPDSGSATDAQKAQAITMAIQAAQAAVNGINSLIEAPSHDGNTDAGDIETELTNATQTLSDAQAVQVSDADPVGAAQSQVDAANLALNTALSSYAIDASTFDDIEVVFTNAFLNNLRQLLQRQTITMPPGSAVAGIYAYVDRTRGVWKAPANVSLSQVIEPAARITNSIQDGMNVSATGKSVNAIRAFVGKGTLVWGARTLAGNDNEWRYVPVRRFFNMAEESIKKATEPFVFESNSRSTWVRIRAMIENFLTLQWRAGALAGAKAEDAFFVRVGLGETMTADDINNGQLIVEIGMAVVRPAEFIILRFSHMMQQS